MVRKFLYILYNICIVNANICKRKTHIANYHPHNINSYMDVYEFDVDKRLKINYHLFNVFELQILFELTHYIT